MRHSTPVKARAAILRSTPRVFNQRTTRDCAEISRGTLLLTRAGLRQTGTRFFPEVARAHTDAPAIRTHLRRTPKALIIS